MTNRPSLPWPPWTLALDIVGTLLLALGIIGLTGNLVPDTIDSADVRAASIAFIVVGVLLMLPFLVTVIRQALSGNRPGAH